MYRIFTVIVLCLLFVPQLSARELGGVSIEESIVIENGKKLVLNGAGIRSKFFFDIYIAALYLETSAHSANQVINDTGSKRMLMHFLYDEVDKKSLVDAWNEGFAGNMEEDALKSMQSKIDIFNGWFASVKKGEEIILDYLPETGTKVIINGVEKGVVEGKEFNDGLLSIWLGKKPVTKALKKSLLNAE